MIDGWKPTGSDESLRAAGAGSHTPTEVLTQEEEERADVDSRQQAHHGEIKEMRKAKQLDTFIH